MSRAAACSSADLPFGVAFDEPVGSVRRESRAPSRFVVMTWIASIRV